MDDLFDDRAVREGFDDGAHVRVEVGAVEELWGAFAVGRTHLLDEDDSDDAAERDVWGEERLHRFRDLDAGD